MHTLLKLIGRTGIGRLEQTDWNAVQENPLFSRRQAYPFTFPLKYSLRLCRQLKPQELDKEQKVSFLKGNNCRFLSFLEGNFLRQQPIVGIDFDGIRIGISFCAVMISYKFTLRQKRKQMSLSTFPKKSIKIP